MRSAAPGSSALVIALVVTALTGCGGAGRSPTTPTGPVAEAPRAQGATQARFALVEALSADALEGRAPGTPASARARELLKGALTACGYEVVEEAATVGPGVNLLAYRAGEERLGRWVLLSAHYDHLGVLDGRVMNGADDNAAAVGSVVEVACRISKIEANGRRRANLLVALWDTEEPPYFLTPAMGSSSFVERLRSGTGLLAQLDPTGNASAEDRLATLDAAIVLDLVGHGLWPGFPAHIALGAETSQVLEATVASTPTPGDLEVVQASLHLVERLVTRPGHRQAWSDYAAFREAGVPILFLSNGQSHHYHRETDDFETLDLDKLGQQTDWLLTLVLRLLEHEERPRFEDREERPAIDLAAARRLVEGALSFVDSGRAGSERFDRESLQADLERLARDTSPISLRRAVQRVQCHAVGTHPKPLCAGL